MKCLENHLCPPKIIFKRKRGNISLFNRLLQLVPKSIYQTNQKALYFMRCFLTNCWLSTSANDHYNVKTFRKLAFHLPKRFSQPSFPLIPHDRIPDATRDRYTKPRMASLRGLVCTVHNQWSDSDRLTLSVDTTKVSRTEQSQLFLKTKICFVFCYHLIAARGSCGELASTAFTASSKACVTASSSDFGSTI